MNVSCFEQIEGDALTAQQRRVIIHGNAANHFRMIRSPTCVRELIAFLQTNKRSVLWINGESAWISEESSFRLYDSAETSRLYLSINNHRFCLSGQSDYQVAQVAAFIWTLDNSNTDDYIYIHGPTTGNKLFDFNVLSSEPILSSLLTKRVALLGVNVPAELAMKLALQPQPIHLMLYDSSFADNGEAFLEALGKRRTPFGSLILNGCTSMKSAFLSRLYKAGMLEFLRVVSYDKVTGNANLLPFASRAKKVEFEVVIPGDEWNAIKSVTIVPERFILKMTRDMPGLASLFLRATANLTEMGLVMKYAPSEQTWCDLIAAVDCNQNLKELELGELDRDYLSRWGDLIGVIGRHPRLCKLKLHCKCEPPSEEDLKLVDGLVSMLQCNRNIINVNFVGQHQDVWMSPLKECLRFNRFFRGSDALTRETELERMRLLGMTMVERTRHDARNTALLLANNTDALCMLLNATI